LVDPGMDSVLVQQGNRPRSLLQTGPFEVI
jgi:hypothetical protein